MIPAEPPSPQMAHRAAVIVFTPWAEALGGRLAVSKSRRAGRSSRVVRVRVVGGHEGRLRVIVTARRSTVDVRAAPLP